MNEESRAVPGPGFPCQAEESRAVPGPGFTGTGIPGTGGEFRAEDSPALQFHGVAELGTFSP